jgi:phage-related protein
MDYVFPWVPSYGSAVSKKPDVHVTKLGDGYEVRTMNVLNNSARKWTLTFSRANAVADAIDDFLTERNASQSFSWTPPRGPVGRWVCREWSLQPTSQNTATVSASFEEVFEVVFDVAPADEDA